MKTEAQSQFDVFLCHNREDKEAVRKIAEQLKSEYKIEPWLDDWELQPGLPWQPELEKQIAHIKSAAVFVGQSGIGPWQEDEINGFLREFKRRKCPVFPVLLPDAPQKPSLPIFLEGITWVDFREQTRFYTPPMVQLVWGITGKKPQTIVKVIPQSPTQNTPRNQTDDSGDDLSSEKGVDYTKLRDALAAGKWKEADNETYLVMLQAVGREENDWIREEELLNFPCTDLRTIDQLWVNYSNARFGFSVQKEIYLSVGGKPNGRYHKEAWKKFGDRVGWRVKQSWIDYDEVTFDKTAPQGHLPVVVVQVGGGLGGGLGLGLVGGGPVVWCIFSRIETCKV
ncbi:MAG: TIR domain-containing protein [Scytonema sp. RU_4_4]|nr:TIR domain-containing protein [Scytonema sp. RU_4_4]